MEKTGAVALRVDFSEKGVSLVICGKSGGYENRGSDG